MAAWHELFPLYREPTMEDIAGYIDHPLWDAFTAFIDESYGAKPRIEYSRCGGAPGWNVKYKARGRALPDRLVQLQRAQQRSRRVGAGWRAG